METLDEVDIQILNILQQNARITNKDLAAKLGMSTTPIFERIKKLEKKGYIKDYVALLDNELVEKGLTVFLFLSIKEHNRKTVKEMYDALMEIPEILESYHVGGDFDYLLKVVVKDMKAYENFLLNKMTVIQNVKQMKSTFVLSRGKYTTTLQLEKHPE